MHIIKTILFYLLSKSNDDRSIFNKSTPFIDCMNGLKQYVSSSLSWNNCTTREVNCRYILYFLANNDI